MERREDIEETERKWADVEQYRYEVCNAYSLKVLVDASNMTTYGYPYTGGSPNYDPFCCILTLAMVLQVDPISKPIMILFDKVKMSKSGISLTLAYGGFCMMIAAISFLLHQHVCATFNIYKYIYFLAEDCWWRYIVDRYMFFLTLFLGQKVPLFILKIWDMSKIVVSFFLNSYSLAPQNSFITNSFAFFCVVGVTCIVIAWAKYGIPNWLKNILSKLKACCKEKAKTFPKQYLENQLRREEEEHLYLRKLWHQELAECGLPSRAKKRQRRRYRSRNKKIDHGKQFLKRKPKKGNSTKRPNPWHDLGSEA